MKQGDALGEQMQMLKASNAQVEAIKVNTDMNDDYVKTQVDTQTQDVMDKKSALSQAGHTTTWNELESVMLKQSKYDE